MKQKEQNKGPGPRETHWCVPHPPEINLKKGFHPYFSKPKCIYQLYRKIFDMSDIHSNFFREISVNSLFWDRDSDVRKTSLLRWSRVASHKSNPKFRIHEYANIMTTGDTTPFAYIHRARIDCFSDISARFEYL